MTVDYLSFAIILAGLGVVMFAAEYFLPTGGILIVTGFLLCFGAVVVVAANTEDQRETIAALVAMCVGVPVAGTTAMYWWGKRMALKAEDERATDDPETEGVERMKGRFGRTVTPMRPSGAVDFDGRRMDAVTEGMLIEANTWVKCIEIRAGKLIVRQVSKPPDLGEMDLNGIT